MADKYERGDYTIPRIIVENKTQPLERQINKGGRVAIIGAFPSLKTSIGAYQTLRDLRDDFGIIAGTKSETDFDGALAAARLFMEGIPGHGGAEQVIVCNISEPSSETNVSGIVTDDEESSVVVDPERGSYSEDEGSLSDDVLKTLDTKLTKVKLENALAKIKGEDIDLLFIATSIEDDAEADKAPGEPTPATLTDKYGLICQWLGDEFELQRPVQLVAPLITSTPSVSTVNEVGNASKTIKVTEATEVAKIFKDNPFLLAGLYCQKLTIAANQYQTGTQLSVIESAAHMCAFIAESRVDTSLTRKDIPGVVGVDEELYFGQNDDGYKLVRSGISVIRSKNRADRSFCVVNSELPSGYDISHIRSVSYLIKQYELEELLGTFGSNQNIEAFKAQLNAVNRNIMGTLGIFNDIDTNDVQKVSTNEVVINLKVDMAGVILVVDLGVDMEVN